MVIMGLHGYNSILVNLTPTGGSELFDCESKGGLFHRLQDRMEEGVKGLKFPSSFSI